MLEIKKLNLSTAQDESNKLNNDVQIITRCLEERKLNYVTNYYINQADTGESLLYQVDGLAKEDALNLLESLMKFLRHSLPIILKKLNQDF